MDDRGGPFVSLARAALAAGSVLQFRARGGSMEPTIPHGAVVAIAPLADAPLRAGDVLLCLVGGGAVVLHRVVHIGPQGTLMVRGDAPACEVDRIDAGAVLGRAIGLLERGRLHPLDGRGGRLLVSIRRARHLLRTLDRRH
jgi:hypothetical protein